MTAENKAALALIIGTMSGLVTMMLHPTSRDVVASLSDGGHGTLNKFAHSLALFAQPLLVMGMLAFTLRFTTHREEAIAAFILFAWASIAILLATATSGFVATDILSDGVHHRMTEGAVDSALHYTSLLNRAFATIYIAFSALAILIWSIAMLRAPQHSNLLGAYGVLASLACLALVPANRGVSIHGFLAIVTIQGIWFVWVAMTLRRMT
jgi:hypothetical protein